MKLEGQNAIITGGCSGLGLATAKYLISKGAKVILFDISAKNGKIIVQELGADKAIFCEVDVTKDDEVKQSIQAAVQKVGDIRIFVNCAGILHSQMTATSSKIHSSSSFKKVLDVNVMGTFYMCKQAAWHLKTLQMVDGERGVIINVSSVAAQDGQRGQLAYSASKAAISGMTLPMSRDLGRWGVRVISIAPGPFITPLGKQISQKIIQGIARTISLGRLGKPEEFANIVGAIIENSYLSGVTIRLDGGLKVPHI